jgi:hypothetical protein
MMATNDERDILTLALTGTRYSGGAAPQTTPPIDQLPLAEGIAMGDAERALLLRAGAWAIYRRAGYRPAEAPEPPTPASEETRPVCSPGAGEALVEMLRTRRYDLLPEALERLNAAGLRLPPALLPMALSSVGLTLELRAMLAPALGERGRWLAGFNRAWAWAAERSDDAADDPAHAQEVWETGTLRQRAAALRAMRRRDPAAARDLLAAEWKREKAEARAALLGTLAVNLSPDDEPLLEQALADRVDAVRNAAADLLYRLPASHLAQATRELLEATLIFNNGQLDVQAPVTLDSADDEQREILSFAFGSLTPHIDALLQYTSPEHWEEYFGQSADQLIAATGQSRWRDEMLNGWLLATVRFGSKHWAKALLYGWLLDLKRDAALSAAPFATYLEALAPLLPPEELQVPVFTSINTPAYYPHLSLAQLLDCLPRPWPDDVAGLFLEKLGKTLDEWDETASPAEPWISALPLAAVALPDSQFAQAREVCVVADNQHRNLVRWRYQLASFIATLDLRERVIKEIPLL